jgi:hypothetical protein
VHLVGFIIRKTALCLWPPRLCVFVARETLFELGKYSIQKTAPSTGLHRIASFSETLHTAVGF